MGMTPAEIRRVARDFVAREKALPSDAKTRVSDFGRLAGGGYSVLVDVVLADREESAARYRVKTDENGKVTSVVLRQ
jgi:hypothetical protein